MTSFDPAMLNSTGQDFGHSSERGASAYPARQSTIGIASVACGIASVVCGIAPWAAAFAPVPGMFPRLAPFQVFLLAVAAFTLGILGRSQRVVGHAVRREAATAGLVIGSVVMAATALFVGFILLVLVSFSGA